MKHSRADYNRIQDPAQLIPADEPVFLLRGQDKYAPDVLREYASRVYDRGKGDAEAMREIYAHAERMEAWQREHGAKVPDAPRGDSCSTVPNPSCEPATLASASKTVTSSEPGLSASDANLDAPLPDVAEALESQRDNPMGGEGWVHV